jgi:hypothetical protein
MAIWNRIEQIWKRSDQTWKQIDQSPIPLSVGRIWLADENGDVRRAMSWTWPMLQRREPHKYRQWMIRLHGAKAPPPEAGTPGA